MKYLIWFMSLKHLDLNINLLGQKKKQVCFPWRARIAFLRPKIPRSFFFSLYLFKKNVDKTEKCQSEKKISRKKSLLELANYLVKTYEHQFRSPVAFSTRLFWRSNVGVGKPAMRGAIEPL